jgi:hypothetical protein
MVLGSQHKASGIPGSWSVTDLYSQ